MLIVEKSIGILKINNVCCVDDEEYKCVYYLVFLKNSNYKK